MRHPGRVLSLVVVAGLELLVGCTQKTGQDAGDLPSAAPAPAAADSAADLQFIDRMIPHHEMAVMMVDMELQQGAHAGLKALAQEMRTAQEQEIAKMRSIRQSLTATADVPASPPAAAGEMDHPMIEGTGKRADLSFIDGMIPHHQGAIDDARQSLPKLHDEELRQIAQNILDSQAREINELERIRKELSD